MFSFSFASKMLNTIMGTEEQQQQQQQQAGGGGLPQQSMGGPPGQQGMRPMGTGGFPQVRPTPQGPGGAPRPGFPGPPTFSGPRPSPGVRTGPPSFGGPPRPTMGGVGQPHRFNGPQPPQQQQMQQQQPQMQQQQPQQMQQQNLQQQQQPPLQQGQIPRGMSPVPGGIGRAPSPGARPRGPGPSMGGPNVNPNQPFPIRPTGVVGPPPSSAAPVPDVDLSHLSAEERAMIESVMAKAQQLDQGPPTSAPAAALGQMAPQRMMRPDAQLLQQQQPGIDLGGGRLCPLCRQRDVSGKMDGIPGQECTECRALVCNRCGGMSPHPETKRPEWTCGNCINKRRQRMGQFPPGNVAISQSPQQQHQNLGQRPLGPYGSNQLQQPMQTIDPDGGRRGSGVGLQGGPQQQAERIGIQPTTLAGDMGNPRRRMPGQNEMIPVQGLGQQQQQLRPSLRPQRSLDNRLPSTQPQQQVDMLTGLPMDQQGNLYATNNNANTQAVTQSVFSNMDNQGMGQSQGIMTSSLGPTTSQQHAMNNISSNSSILSQQQLTDQQQSQQGMFGSTMPGNESQQQQQQLDIMQRSTQQPQHLGQLGGEGVGAGLNEWNNVTHQQQPSMIGPTSISASSTDHTITSTMQSYQQQPTSTYSQQNVATSLQSQGMTPQQQQQQQFQQTNNPQTFQQDQTISQLQPQQQQSSFQSQQTLPQQIQTSQQQQQQPFQTQQQLQNQQNQQQQFPGQVQSSQTLSQQVQQPMGSQQQPQMTAQGLQNQQQPQQIAGQALQNQQPQMTGQGLQSQQLQQLQVQQAQAQQLAQQSTAWQQSTEQSQQQQQQQQMYDQAGRLIPTSIQPSFPNNQTQSQDQYQQAMNMMQQQYNQQHGTQGIQQLGSVATSVPGQPGAVSNVITSQAGPGAKSISGLLADFTRVLGLGSTSPRPSPSEDKSLSFPMASGQMQPLSPYDQYQQQQLPTSGSQQISHQHSAFAPIHDSYQRQNQQLSYLPQSSQAGLQTQLGSQNLQYGTGGQGQQSLSSQSQQYLNAALASQQPYQIMAHGALQQQQTGNVGVIGALSPAQAHMYQQQMAMQHQQQHMKKRSRGGHLSSSGEMRRDVSGQPSTVLIGGTGLAVTPSGMTIGALTPAVVTSLGQFIGGGPAILGIQQPMAGTHGASQGFGGGLTPLGTPPIGTPVGTPRSGREPPGAGDSSDTMSETDSQKSLRMRRKLPCLPPDQEAAPLPSAKKRDRQRSHEQFRSLSPLRMSSTDGGMSGRSYPFSSLSLSRPSASESNLRKISMTASDPVPRPGSALGLLQASSVVSSVGGKPDMGYPLNSSLFSTSSNFPGMRTASGYPTDLTNTTSVLAGLYPSHKSAQESWNANLAELAACLPPDLRHLLNKGGGPSDHDLSGLSGLSGMTTGLGDTSLNSGSHLPSYMRTLREQLQEERRQVLSEERRRLEQLRERDRELGARLDAVTSRAGNDGMRSRADLSRNVGISRSAGASPLLSRKLKGHRRQLSDPKLSLPFSPIQEDGDSELQDFDRISADLLRPPYKSYEYESLEDNALLHHRPSSIQPQFDWDHSQSYLTSSWAAAGGVLRETAINSMGGGGVSSEDEHFRSRVASRFLSRRNSEGESSLSTSRFTSSGRDRRHQMRKHRKSRSWHPSPYVSEEEEEEEEDMLSREEKKARIKAEIARRRQQMQERGGIHNELNRYRDGTDQERHSVLKSVDQLIRDQYGRYEQGPSSYARSLMYSGGPSSSAGLVRYPQGHHVLSGNVISPCASEEDRSIERIASTFRSEELYYERLGEMSPMATDSESMGSELGAPAAMPILPDMPTRSRRLLEDLGSAPIGLNEGSRGGPSSGQNMTGYSRRQSPPMGPVAPKPSSRVESASEKPLIENRRRHAEDRSQQMMRYPEDYGAIGGTTRKTLNRKKVTTGLLPEEPQKHTKKSQTSDLQRTEKKYEFPVKRYLLTRDPKDRSVSTNGIGVKIVGGKEIPGSSGVLGAYIAKIHSGKLVDSIPEIQEGDLVLEWNGVSLDNKTFEDVSSILQESSTDEIELVLRSDYNILTGKPRPVVENFSKRNDSKVLGTRKFSDSKNLYQQESIDDGNESSRRPSDCFHSSTGTLESDMNMGHHFQADSSNPYAEISDPGGGSGSSQKNIMCNSTLAKSPSSSTEATNTSAGSIYQSTNVLEEASKTSHHLAIPSEIDLRKRSTTSLPPSLTDVHQTREETHSTEQYGRKGSENISIKSMGPMSIGNEKRRQAAIHGKKNSHGQIQLQICHDPKACILYVTVLKARLPKQKNEDGTDHVQVDPYVTVYLLPDRVLENQRRTRHVPMCSSPQWNQTMVYPNVSVADLKEKYLEVSARNYNPTGDEDSLFGKVILYLSDDGILDEQPHSYSLRLEEKPYRRKSGQTYLKSQQTTKSTTGSSVGNSSRKDSNRHSRCSLTEIGRQITAEKEEEADDEMRDPD